MTLEDGKTSMFMDWQNQYCENGHITKIDLQMQCNPHQNSNGALNRKKEKVLNFTWRHKRSCLAKEILSKMSNTEGAQYLASKYTTEP
jgi:hypothetical protein